MLSGEQQPEGFIICSLHYLSCSPLLHAALPLPLPRLQSIPTVDDSVEVVLAALQRHGLASAAVLGHSYGSLVAARLVRVAPQVVHTLAVVDPVSTAAAAAAAACALVHLVWHASVGCTCSGGMLSLIPEPSDSWMTTTCGPVVQQPVVCSKVPASACPACPQPRYIPMLI
jgi:hypothetical protein